MDRNETITLLQLQRGAQIVGVRFTQQGRDGSRYPSKLYSYKSVFRLAPGDLVVVEASDGFKVGSVDKVGMGLDAMEETGIGLGELRHVVGKVDLERHASVKLEERMMVELIMKAELDAKLRSMTSDPIFAQLMGMPMPAASGLAYTPAGTPHDPSTGEVVA